MHRKVIHLKASRPVIHFISQFSSLSTPENINREIDDDAIKTSTLIVFTSVSKREINTRNKSEEVKGEKWE